MDLTALSVTTVAAAGGGSLTYNNTTGVFTFAPADELGNLVVNGPDIQTISGTVNGADIVLEPLNGSVQVPALKIGTEGSVLNTTLNIEAYITTYELVRIIDSSTGPGDNLPIGTYGNINGVPAPWTVFELSPGISGTPISAIEIDDKLTGAGIVPSTVRDRGLGDDSTFPEGYSYYVIVDLDLAGLGQVLPLPGAVFNLTRPLDKANLNIQSATGTDIFLDSTGLGDVIVNTNILPVTTNISNLGSPTKRWKSVYIGPGTIYVLDETLGKDIAIGARDGLLYVQNGAGLTVGEFTLIDNQILLANPARDIIIGSIGATADIVFNRSIKVKDSVGRTAFYTDRTGRTQFYPPTIPNGDIGGVSIIGSADGSYQPVVNSGGMLHITGNNETVSRITNDAFGTGSFPAYISRAGRGTAQSPSAIISGDILSRYSTVGWGTTDFAGASVPAATNIEVYARENFTDSASGTEYRFYTAPIGTTTKTLSLTINDSGVSFVNNPTITAGITFRNGDRLTYFPTPVGQTNLWLKSNGSTMSWQALPVAENPLVYKGAWNASSNSPALSTTTPVGLISGWEYSISTGGTQNINGTGNVTYAAGGFVIFNGATWDYIPPMTGVASIQFDGGSVQTGAVQVQSSDIVSTLDTGSIANAKLANSSVTVTAGTGLSGGGTVALGGSITLTNAGITSLTAGTGIGISGANGAKTITNTGVLTVTGTNHISASVVSGAVTVTSDATANDTSNTIALRDGTGGLIAKDFSATRDATLSTDHGPFNFGDLSYSDTGIMADFSMSTNSYNQVILQNRSAGAAASTNYIVSNNQGTASTFYGEFGMNSSGFSGVGSFALPNAVYLASVSSDLVIGTLGNNTLRIVTNNSGTDAVTVNASGVATFANQIVGSISGSANNVRQAVTFATSGGAAPGSTFNGASALTVDYSTVGAQAPLSSGVNIKTVNNNSLVGSGNVSVGTVTSVGGTGTVSGLTLTGTVTGTGNLTLGGTISGLTTSNLSSTANIANSQLANSTISGVSLGNGLYNLKPGTNISFVGATNYNGSTEVTVNVATTGITAVTPNTLNTTTHIVGNISGTTLTISTDATTAATPSTIVVRDSTGTINVSGWTVGARLTAVNYTATTSDYWIGTSAKNKTITLPNAANGAVNGRQYQIADTVHSGNPNTTIAAQSPATVTGNQPSQQSQIVLATYLGGVWYLN